MPIRLTKSEAYFARLTGQRRRKPVPRQSDPAWLAEMAKGPGLFIPLRADTPGNGSHGHWRKAAAKVKAQRDTVYIALVVAPLEILDDTVRFAKDHSKRLRCTLTRYGWNKMDKCNVHSALKGCIDAIAEYCGVDDGDDRWDWVAKSERARGFGVRIEIEVVNTSQTKGASNV